MIIRHKYPSHFLTTCKYLFDDEGITAECVGSYRRGKKSSGDIDIFLCNKCIFEERKMVLIMKNLIKVLKEKKFLVDDLTNRYTTTYMGICKLDGGKHRHIDIKIWSPAELPFAML